MLFKEPSLMLSGHGFGTAIVLSGIQSTAYGQALGLLPVLKAHFKWVIGYDYDNVSWHHPERLAADFAEIAAYWQRNSGSVTLIGLSIGASMSVLVTQAMRNLRDVELHQQLGQPAEPRRIPTVEDSSRYRVIMVDPPFGSKTMTGVPSWLSQSGLAHPFFALGGAVVPASVKLPGEPEVPTDEQLQLPSTADMHAMFAGAGAQPDTYRFFARKADVVNQGDHSLRTWLQQLAWLTGGATKLPFEAMKFVKIDMITARSQHYTVVRTAEAQQLWRRHVKIRLTINVDAEHCATLRHQPAYAKAFRDLLSYTE